jgi:photosystem II stability/assembly factor-like uncharacterized protein
MTEEAELTGAELLMAERLADAALFGGELRRPESPTEILELVNAPQGHVPPPHARGAGRPHSKRAALGWIASIAALILVLVGVRVFPSQGTTKPSGPVSPASSSYSNDLYDIDFVTGTVGYAIDSPSWGGKSRSPSATILMTSDGGSTWKVLGETPFELLNPLDSRLVFTNSSTGYLAGDNGLAVTRDGGRTWSVVSSEWTVGLAAFGQEVWTISDRCSAASCSPDVVRGTDDGYRWETLGELPAAFEATVIASLAMTSASSATFITDGAPQSQTDTTPTDPLGTNGIYVTDDAGATWRLSSSCPSGYSNPNQVAATPASDASSASSLWRTCNGGLFSMYQGAPAVGNKLIFRSLDGGDRWSLQASYPDAGSTQGQGRAPAAYIESLLSLSSAKALLATTEGLFGTEDGGKTWQVLGGPNPFDSASPSVTVVGHVAWLSVPGQGLWRSADAWNNWVKIS